MTSNILCSHPMEISSMNGGAPFVGVIYIYSNRHQRSKLQASEVLIPLAQTFDVIPANAHDARNAPEPTSFPSNQASSAIVHATETVTAPAALNPLHTSSHSSAAVQKKRRNRSRTAEAKTRRNQVAKRKKKLRESADCVT